MPDKTFSALPGCGMSLPVHDRKPTVEPEKAKWFYEQEVIIDEKSLQPTVQVSKRDLDKEIQSYKDECGMAFVLRQIAAGRLSIRDLADDGKGGVDVLGLPETLNDASQAALVAQQLGKEEAAKLGLKAFTEEELQNYINQEIKKAQEAKANQATNEEAK